MKIEVVKKEAAFKPVTLTITIETEQEFCDLYNRMSQAPVKINKDNDTLIYNSKNIPGLFGVLDDLLDNEYKYLKK